MQVLYRRRDHVKALGWLHSFSLCVRAPAEIYCNGSGGAVWKLKALRTD